MTQDWLREHFIYKGGSLFRVKTWSRSGRHRRLGLVGSRDSHGYLTTMIQGRHFKIHRLVWFYFKGTWPKQIDHVNGKRDDNRIENLRPCDHATNQWNRKVNGVYFGKDSKSKPWKASISVRGSKIYLGRFSNERAALRARRKAEKELRA